MIDEEIKTALFEQYKAMDAIQRHQYHATVLRRSANGFKKIEESIVTAVDISEQVGYAMYRLSNTLKKFA